MSFDDNRLVPLLYGQHDTNLARIEHQLGVRLASRGNALTIRGPGHAAEQAQRVLSTLWDRLEKGMQVGSAEVDAIVRLAGENGGQAALASYNRPENGVVIRRRTITPRTPNQAVYIEALRSHDLVLGLGPAGTGKTYLAVAQAVAMLTQGRVSRIVLSRPAVEAGERLGFLPGDMREKVDPYLRPLYDALYDMLPAEQVQKHIDNGIIEIAPLAFMRGRTLSDAYVILDEAQNTTAMQMRMFLTRLGQHSQMVVTGDATQVDLPSGVRSGLLDAMTIADGLEGAAIVRFGEQDVVRHPLVARIVHAYEKLDQRAAKARKSKP